MADLLLSLQAALAGRYAIEREVGRGGMATVWLALDVKHERRVAIKVLRPELQAVLGAERFLRETTLAAGLAHPHILPVHDSGTAGEFLYYVMPFVEGESLRDRLARERQLSISDALRIAGEIADALNYAHSHGIVHRDIKPENILFEAGHAVITDFGIARAISAAGGDRLTQTGIVIGTPAYMSPEQAVGEQQVDGRSDIYSLGCVLYEMLTGQPPFTAPSAQAVMARHTLDPVPPPRTVRAAVSAAVERVLLKALEKLPADRFATAGQFADALAEAGSQGGAPVALPTRRAARLRVVVGALGVAVLALGAWWLHHRVGTPPTRIDSLAVLPIANLTGQDDQEYFVEGVHDALIGELGRISALRVISRTSVMRYRNTDKGVPEIARELEVQALVEAAASRARDSVHIRVSLIRGVPSERQMWTGTYDGAITGIVRLEKRIAWDIARQIQARVSPQERERLATARSVDPAAFDAWARGWFQYSRLTRASLRACLVYADSAARIDPEYAAAYALSGSCYVNLNLIQGMEPQVAFPRARRAAMRALELDSTLADAYYVLARTLALYDWDWSGAERAYRRGLELRPNPSSFGWFLAWLGRFDEAVAYARQGEQLNPVDPVAAQNASAVLYAARRYDDAIASAQRSIAIDSSYAFAYVRLGSAYAGRGLYQQAVAAFRQGMALSGGDPSFRMGLARVNALAGRGDSALKILADLERLGKRSYVAPTSLAIIHAALGENDAAIAWLERGYRVRDGNMVLLKVWPEYDPLRGDPRFQSLLRRMKFPAD